MKRRNFIKGLLCAPVVGAAMQKQASAEIVDITTSDHSSPKLLYIDSLTGETFSDEDCKKLGKQISQSIDDLPEYVERIRTK